MLQITVLGSKSYYNWSLCIQSSIDSVRIFRCGLIIFNIIYPKGSSNIWLTHFYLHIIEYWSYFPHFEHFAQFTGHWFLSLGCLCPHYLQLTIELEGFSSRFMKVYSLFDFTSCAPSTQWFSQASKFTRIRRWFQYSYIMTSWQR